MDWDKLAKNPDNEEGLNIAGGAYSAVPPPPADNDSNAEIAAAPIKYSVPPPDTVNAKLLTVSSNAATGEKRPANKETDVPGAKKQKGELFREKEKRKRDLGMTSRGKSFVEEEKRILRQQFGQ